MAKRAMKPASRATQAEVNRVAIITAAELAETSAYSISSPAVFEEMKVWLRVDQAVSDVNGVSSIPDGLGGSPAVQTVNAQKLTLGTTGNGLAKLTGTASTGMTLPVSAGLADTAYFAMALWLRPTNLASSSTYFSAIRTAVSGTASADRTEIRQNTNDVRAYVWLPAGIRSVGSDPARGFFYHNLWRFVSFEFIGSGAAETDRAIIRDAGTPLATPMAATYIQENGTAPSMPTSLNAITGSVLLFNRLTTYVNGFQGEIGPDIFFYDPRTMTDEKRVQLAQYRVPTL